MIYILHTNLCMTVFIGSQIKCLNRRFEPTFLFLFLLTECLLSDPQMEEENNKIFSEGRPFWYIRNPEICLRELEITGRNPVLLQSLVKRLLPLCEIDLSTQIYIYIYIYIYIHSGVHKSIHFSETFSLSLV